MTPEPPRTVVGAVVVRGGRVLAVRRTRPEEIAGLWEFPGGKVEPGEDPVPALVREVREELSATIGVVAEIAGDVGDGGPWPISDTFVLRLFLATVVDGEPRPDTDHDLLRWLDPEDLESVEWLPSDREALPAIRAMLEDPGLA